MIIENLPGSEKNFKIIFRNGSDNKTFLQTGFISDTRKVSINIQSLSPGIYAYELSGKVAILKTGKLVKQ